MSDNILSAVLTFTLLVAGTVAVGAEMFPGRAAAMPVATLAPVTVIGHRAAAADSFTLPMVTVTGCRHGATSVAVDTSDDERRVQ